MSKHKSTELAGGFNHSLYVDTDLMIANVAANDLSSTIAAFGIPAGGIVTGVCVHQITPFAGGSTNAELTIQVGDGDDPNGYIISTDYFSGADTATVFNTGAYFNDGTTDNVINGKVYTAADTIDILIQPDVTVAGMSVGAFLVCANILDPGSYVPS
jgi:hypothetical protein